MTSLLDVFSDWNPRYLEGTNEYRMECPYRENHDASSDGAHSFVFVPDKNFAHCYSCGKTMSGVELLTGSVFKMGYMDALECVNLENIEDILKAGEDDKIRPYELPTILDIQPPQYFLDKGISARILNKYKVGFKSTWDGMENIHIPLYDEFDNLLSVKHRIERQFWYEPKMWDKRSYLYNLKEALQYEQAILVEGETDVWKSVQYGSPATVGTLGGGFTIAQSIKMRRFKEIYLGFDNDNAGIKNTEIAYYLLRQHTELWIVDYSAKDPCDSTKKEWNHGISNALSYAEYTYMMSDSMGAEYDQIKSKVLKSLKSKELL